MTERTWESGSYMVPVTFKDGDEESVAHQGRCDEDVEALCARPYMQEQFETIDREDMRLELKGYGAWDEDELANDWENFQRLVWIAGCDLKEEAEHD